MPAVVEAAPSGNGTWHCGELVEERVPSLCWLVRGTSFNQGSGSLQGELGAVHTGSGAFCASLQPNKGSLPWSMVPKFTPGTTDVRSGRRSYASCRDLAEGSTGWIDVPMTRSESSWSTAGTCPTTRFGACLAPSSLESCKPPVPEARTRARCTISSLLKNLWTSRNRLCRP